MTWLMDGVANGWRAGAPFGHGSHRWRRARDANPTLWDEGCHVTPLIGGRAAMDAIRDAFEQVIAEATAGHSCHVYIAGWRLNPNRDMSVSDQPPYPLSDRDRDTTAWGLVRRMMLARVKVRILLWLPPTEPFEPPPFVAHTPAHLYLGRLVKAADSEVKLTHPLPGDDWGVVFLDTRLASQVNRMVASHHQKFIVVRGQTTNVAFCGGVDLAFTRRDSPLLQGDAQSGTSMPSLGQGIATDVTNPIPWELDVRLPTSQDELVAGSDLPLALTLYGTRQIWHDQHLKLEGPVVTTLENIFRERWAEPAARYIVPIAEDVLIGEDQDVPLDSVLSSSANAIETVTHRRTHAIGSFRLHYPVGHGVTKEDVLSVTVNGRPVPKGNYEVGGHGLRIVRDPDGARFRTRSGEQLVIRFNYRRPKALPVATEVGPSATTPTARVQVWTTIPLRSEARGAGVDGDWATSDGADVASPAAGSLTDDAGAPVDPPPYRLGDFSAMAGIAYAAQQSRQFIWIFDQYFWSVPYARLLENRLRHEPALHIVIVLPPWSDMGLALGQPFLVDAQHTLRWNALRVLGESDFADRVAVYVPWYDHAGAHKAIYCHAKTQLFDDQLLVCGSCNLNERSFSVDTELVCAVESQDVVRAHYRALWDLFVGSIPGSFPNYFGEDWGAVMFHGISVELGTSGIHHLHADDGHRRSSSTLPNGVVRSVPEPYILLDVGAAINEPFGLPEGLYSGSSLADIVDLLERSSSPDRESGF